MNVKNLTSATSKCTLEDLSIYLQTIGIIRSLWISNDQTHSFQYGTAFALSNLLICTCTHIIYNEHQRTFANQVRFYPNATNKKLAAQNYSINLDGQYYQCQTPKISLAIEPTIQEICLIAMKIPLSAKQFLRVGNLSHFHEKIEFPISTVGYPSRTYYKEVECKKAKAKRTYINGSIMAIEGHKIHHNLNTKGGMSGSPLIIKDNGQLIVIGIHSHKGLYQGWNSGVLFKQSSSLIKLKEMEQKLAKRFNLTGKGILLFEQRVKQSGKLRQLLNLLKQNQFYQIMFYQSQTVKQESKFIA